MPNTPPTGCKLIFHKGMNLCMAVTLSNLTINRPPTNAPKPNTRFLRNIIRETDSHNAALRDKETQESQARLQDLSRHNQANRRACESEAHRRIRSVDVYATKRRKLDRDDDSGNENERSIYRHRSCNDSRSKHSSHRNDRDKHRYVEVDRPSADERSATRSQPHDHDRHHSHKHRHRKHYGEERDQSSVSRRHSRSRDLRSPDRTEAQRVEHRRRRRSRDRDKPTVRDDATQEESRVKQLLGTKQTTQHVKRSTRHEQDSDSDPLEALGLIGPRPLSPSRVVAKGRGAFTGGTASGIDRHFQANYDPSIDVAPSDPDTGQDDWDQALEALRDRQRWQQQGAERLRQAGFSEQDISKWENGKRAGQSGSEAAKEDVRWSKRGESREWDRGKVVGIDGAVATEIEWGRLQRTESVSVQATATRTIY